MDYKLHPKTWILAIGVMVGCLLCNFGVAAYCALHGKPIPDFVSGGLTTFGMGLIGLLGVPKSEGTNPPPAPATDAPTDTIQTETAQTGSQSKTGRE